MDVSLLNIFSAAAFMLGHFPTPSTDELFYSICARYGARVNYTWDRSLLLELFGYEGTSSVIDLPSRLNHLISVLPLGSSLTVNRIIDEYTLFPYFSHFLPIERVKQIRKNMRNSGGAAPYMRSGLAASRIPTLSHLRFCPLCATEDRKADDAYWRRLHQVSGVEVCHRHKVFLELSEVSIGAARKRHQFICAEESVKTFPIRSIDLKDRNHQVLLQISADAAWLLEHPSGGYNLESLYKRYLKLLEKRALAIYSGSINVDKLLREFQDFYTPELLKLLNCEFTGSNQRKTNWLLRLVRQPRNAHHPLYHLLLMQFLGYTPEEFFAQPEELGIFVDGPWPCLNRTADHFGQSVVTDFRYGKRQRRGKPMGIFSCKCGFSFVRSGPDTSPEDRYRIGKVITYGPIWEAELKRCWNDSSLTIMDIRRRLGVDHLTVLRHADRLGLPAPSLSKKIKPISHELRLKSSEEAEKEKRNKYRSIWLDFINQNPGVTLTELSIKLSGPYQWLQENDLEWMKENSPAPKPKIHYNTGSVDWEERDNRFVAEVKEIATRLRERNGRPVWITKTGILNQMGALWVLNKQTNKLPLTKLTLESVAETLREYAIRRVKWAADCYIQEGIIPLESQLMSRASLHRHKCDPEIRKAVRDMLIIIETTLSAEQMIKAAS